MPEVILEGPPLEAAKCLALGALEMASGDAAAVILLTAAIALIKQTSSELDPDDKVAEA